MLTPAAVSREIHGRGPLQGRFALGDTLSALPKLKEEYAGKVKMIYIDPPYMTGSRFEMRVRVGEEDWKRGKGSLALRTFEDPKDRDTYLAMMRRVLTACRDLLREDGMLFVHVDWRAHPHLRLMLDEIFREENFLNEIIWAYQTGGRTRKYFSRKHDVILFYRKSAAYDFNIEEVMVTPTEPRSNHMRRHVDPDGRVYRSVRVGGKVYTYYDDDPVAPGDVWSDLSHLQQKDPERTGYDTQKPLKLLDRIVRCGSREGELVMDLFAGSSTTLEAARRAGRRFYGMDACPLTLNIARRRLAGCAYAIDLPLHMTEAACAASAAAGIGFYQITLERFVSDRDGLPAGLDAVDGWMVGFLNGTTLTVMDESFRTRRTPALKTTLELPAMDGTPVLCVCDVTGASHYYHISVP